MPEAKYEVLVSYPVPSRDDRKSGRFEIVRRTTDDTPPRTFIERRLYIGERYLMLPRDIGEPLIEAIRQGFPAAEKHYEALVEDMNKRPSGRG
jgi:hypothetical protein